jgi:hypothetical protein
MAEQQDDKSKPLLAGVAVLVTLFGGLLVYHDITLKTSRPIDKEKANHLFLDEGQVPARLWQDPFEAVETYELNEAKRRKDLGQPSPPPNVDAHIEKIRQIIIVSPKLLVLPVFMDGSPYSSGAENRLNDRYAVVSALGAAGYRPESGENVRFFKYALSGNRPGENLTDDGEKQDAEPNENNITTIPVELFIPKKKEPDKQNVMVLWLKEQELGGTRLRHLHTLLEKLEAGASPGKSEQDKSKIELTYKVLGPRFSTGLSAMLKDLQTASTDIPPDSPIRSAEFYSPWATTDDSFLLPQPPDPSGEFSTSLHSKTINEICPNIKLIRTIKTDAALVEQLLQEMGRRQVALRSCADKDCNPRVALISEWDTLYGRALPCTFAAAVMNGGSVNTSQEPAIDINKRCRDPLPKWISHHSYLAGLDGELPAKSNDKQASETQAKNMAEHGNQRVEQEAAERPEGRSQLDYVRRLAASLKQEQDKNGEKGEFKAIGVLGGDVYDKLLILQALRPTFPRAIFFTTDLNARLTYPAEWEWTRNLIVASNFGLELREELQTLIPPFRDSYQTSVFYAALWALGHFVPENNANCPDCFFQVRGDKETAKFSTDVKPRLYEIGRHGAFDISTDPHPLRPDYASIHPARPDLVFTDEMLKKTELGVLTAAFFIIGTMLLSSTITAIVIKITKSRTFWIITTLAAATGYGVAQWMILKVPMAANEPFAISDGISAWPAMIIGLLALFMSIGFLWYCWKMLKDNENALTHEFALESKTFEERDGIPGGKSSDKPRNFRASASTVLAQALQRFVGLHVWRPNTTGHVEADRLWHHYMALGNLKNVAARALPQLLVALSIPFLLMELFGFPNTPCRGTACFTINNVVIFVTVPAMVVLMFYVVDATRLCRRWVDCIGHNKVYWSDEIFRRKPAIQHGDKENVGEWLGIELIARRTEVIGNFIYFPFIILVILGITRRGYFDNWDFPLALVLIFIIDGIIIFVNALALRRSAEIAKREAIKRFESRLIPLSDQIPEEIKQRQQIEWTVNQIRNNQRGAFLPFTQHPIFGAAIALPSGGYGLVVLLEYLATGF